ncbi:MAG TPA: GNAT family N-acetyltransferase [Acidimicrobiales bacterium]|nr:GNAT family N-acetyltransferase [Acidimicrobiales bacterium]
MAETVRPGRATPGIAADADRSARDWAEKAGVEIEVVTAEAGARQAVGVLAGVWPQPDGHLPVTPELAWALAHSGNYVAVARHGAEPVAAALAFRGVDGLGAYLHSHMVGVLPAHQGANVGFALKQHQRAWSLEQGLGRVTWTFDPLVARNAFFNVMKLGARLTSYYVDFYGELTDGVNAGDESDRCLVTWWLDDHRAVKAADGSVAHCDLAALRAAGAVDVLSPGPAGEPVLGDHQPGQALLARVPSDVVRLRNDAPSTARAWRSALRHVLSAAFEEGLQVSAVGRDGTYVISPA